MKRTFPMVTCLVLIGCQGEMETETTTSSTTTHSTTTTTTTAVTTETTASKTAWDSRFDALMETLEDDLAANEASGVSIAVMEGGEITLAATLGSSRPDEDALVTTDTLFQIGSTTKMTTAIAMLQAVERGALSLDDTLAGTYPDSEFSYDATWNDDITMHHLLTHQGAFYDYIDVTASSDDADLVAWHSNIFFPYLWLMATPGTFWNYANPNFDVAGLVVEWLDDDRYYPDIMMEDVYQPLGMNRTFMRKSEAKDDGDFATGIGYRVDQFGNATWGDVVMEDVLDLAHARPAGAGTWTTPTQMMELAKFLLYGDETILNSTLHEQMMTSHVLTGYGLEDTGYGYGIFIADGFFMDADRYYEIPMYSHNGNTNSYSSDFYVFPDQDVAFSILSSGYGTDFSPSVVAAIEALVPLKNPVTGPQYTFDADDLDGHVGAYLDAYNVGEMIVTRKDDTIQISMPTLEKLGIPYSPDLFVISSDVFYIDIEGAWYDLTFIDSDDDGVTDWIRNRYFVGSRTSGKPSLTTVPERTPVDQWLKQARLPQHPLFTPSAPRPNDIY